MPAVAVRHERRKGQEKRSKRPSQLYIAGHWLPPNSPSPTPSPGTNEDGTERLPEVYLFGKVSTFPFNTTPLKAKLCILFCFYYYNKYLPLRGGCKGLNFQP